MKSFHSKLSCIAPFIFFPFLILIRKKRKVVYLFGLFIVISLCGCFLNFYQTNTKPSIDAATLSGLSSDKKHFIIHFSNSINGLENVYVSNDSLYGKIVPLTREQLSYLRPDSNSNKNQIRGKDEKNTLIQVHLYTDAALNFNDSVFAANVSSFRRADVYELNQKATHTNHILSVGGLVLAVAGTVAVVVDGYNNVSIDNPFYYNCPQVYMVNNGVYSFTSGLYSGALCSTLERTDYLPLHTVPYDAANISFKIANAKNEEEFINTVELLQVNHSSEVNVLADRHGNIFFYKKPVTPSSALTGGENDVKGILKQTDEQYYSFDNAADKDGFSDIRLTFDKPKNADKAKLVIRARNSYWSGFIRKEVINLLGDDLEKWRTKQEKADPEDLEKWQTGQALPLMVYIKTNEGWKFVDYYQLIGNTASRDMIMQLDTKNISGNKIELKLETAYRFWDLDFAGIDYSNDQNFTSTVIEPTQATRSDGTDEKQALLNSDKTYVPLVNDEYISFSYTIPQAAKNIESSYFLVSGGYYHNLEHITGKADYDELLKFKKQSAFDKFSREKYKQAQDVAAIMNSLNNN